MNNKKGFTLIEMVVVLAVVAILAAILTPTIAKSIDDAKLTRASNECQVIGAAIASFYKDVGRWPTANGTVATLDDDVYLLYGSVGGDPVAPPTGGAEWDDDTSTDSDTFENQLIANTPGTGANVYPTWTVATQIGWNGPYIGGIKADPYGTYYMCNIQNAYDGLAQGAWVISAGVNRDPETIFDITETTTTLTGDDLGVRLN
jgi:prepilin-type N-terminal cleavage/methylation domain-containing protein